LSQLTKDVFVEDFVDSSNQNSNTYVTDPDMAAWAGAAQIDAKPASSTSAAPPVPHASGIVTQKRDSENQPHASIKIVIQPDADVIAKYERQIKDLEEAVESLTEDLVAASSNGPTASSSSSSSIHSSNNDPASRPSKDTVHKQQQTDAVVTPPAAPVIAPPVVASEPTVSKAKYDALYSCAVRLVKTVLDSKRSVAMLEHGQYDAIVQSAHDQMQRMMERVSETEQLRMQLADASEEAHRMASFEAEVMELQNELSVREVTIQRLTASLTENRASASEKLVDLESQVKELSAQTATMDQLEAELHAEREGKRAVEGQLHALQEDFAAIKSQLETSRVAQANLEAALQQLEQEATYEQQAHVAPLRARVRELEAEVASLQHVKQETALMEQRLAAERETVADRQRQNAAIAAANLQYKEEIASLRDHLEEAMVRLKNAMDGESVVDRRIVHQLLVTYVSRKHDPQVLELMARILHLSEDDRIKMGIAKPQSAVRGWRSMLGFASSATPAGTSSSTGHAAAGDSTSPASDDQPKESLSDLFVQFLLKEAARGETPSQPPTQQ
jgi:hypothetical protein